MPSALIVRFSPRTEIIQNLVIFFLGHASAGILEIETRHRFAPFQIAYLIVSIQNMAFRHTPRKSFYNN
jgi:hypothetical protein